MATGSYGKLHWRGGDWLALGSCTGGVATGWLWELLWRGGNWLALGAALAGATIRLHGSLEYSTVE